MSRWPTKLLGELLLPTEQRDPTQRPDEEFLYVDISSVNNATKEITEPPRVLGAVAPSRARKVVRAGDVIAASVRPALNAVALVPAELNGQICSTGFCVLRANRHLNSRYLFYFSQSAEFVQHLVNRVKGANYPAVTESDMRAALIPVPPPPEQERLVRILDEADALRRLRTQADERTEQLVLACFDEMFGGRRKKAFRREKLEDVSQIASGIAKGRRFNGRQSIEVPYLRVANVQAGHIDLSEVKTIEALPEEVEELALKRGDVLLTEGGDFDKLGRGAMWEYDIPNFIHQNHVFRVRAKDAELDPVFFSQFLLTGEARAYFLSCAKKTTNLASINLTQLRGLPVPLPPLSHQRTFAARVADIRALQSAQAASRQRLDDLFQSLLHRAFQGEL